MLEHDRRRILTALATVLLSAPWTVQAQGYPEHPIRFVVPYPPGGGTDVIARIVQGKLQAALGQNIVIDNKGGAGGVGGHRCRGQGARPTATPCCSR